MYAIHAALVPSGVTAEPTRSGQGASRRRMPCSSLT